MLSNCNSISPPPSSLLLTLPEISSPMTAANPLCFRHSSGTKKWKQGIKLIRSMILKAVLSANGRCRQQQIFCDSLWESLTALPSESQHPVL